MRFRWRRRSRRLLKLHGYQRPPDPIIEGVHGPKPDLGSGNHTVREHTSPSGERCLSNSVAVSRHGGLLPTEIRRNNFSAVENVPVAHSCGPHKRPARSTRPSWSSPNSTACRATWHGEEPSLRSTSVVKGGIALVRRSEKKIERRQRR